MKTDPPVTVVGDPSDPWCEELIIDEATGELLIVFAPTLEALDLLADQALQAA